MWFIRFYGICVFPFQSLFVPMNDEKSFIFFFDWLMFQFLLFLCRKTFHRSDQRHMTKTQESTLSSGIVDIFPSRVSYIWLKWEEATNREFNDEKIKKYIQFLYGKILRGISCSRSLHHVSMIFKFLFLSFFLFPFLLCTFMWWSTGKTYLWEKVSSGTWNRHTIRQAAEPTFPEHGKKELWAVEFEICRSFSEGIFFFNELFRFARCCCWCMGKYFFSPMRKTILKLI